MALRGFAVLEAASQEWEDLFGCNDHSAELEDGGSGGAHIPEHMIDDANELEREMDRRPEYLADHADAVAWTLTHGLRDRLRARAGAEGPRGGDR
jgi:hypothetical protein